MGDLWLSGWEKIDAGPDGGSWANEASPYRLTVHSTEGSSVEGAVRAYKLHRSPPQCTVDPFRRRRTQHIPLNRSAYALKNLPGGVETNRVKNVQIEIVGFAKDMDMLGEAELRWLGEAVFAPILAAVPIRPHFPMFVDEHDGRIAYAGAPQRLNYQQWNVFDGICGHQHVPENDHWDPGKINMAKILSYALGSPIPTPMPNQPPGVNPVAGVYPPLRRGSSGPLFAIMPNGHLEVMGSPEQLFRLMDFGIVLKTNHVDVPEAEFDDYWPEALRDG